MTREIISCDIAVVGGGLAGLTACSLLSEAGADAQLFEATDRLGGRIESLRHPQTRAPLADLGPTWIWPPYQPHAQRWVERLNVTTFDQYESGDAVLDLQHGAAPRRQLLPGQHDMARIHGGPQALVDQLESLTPAESIHLGFAVSSVEQRGDKLILRFHDSSTSVLAKHVVFAVPLRLLAETVEWNDLLEESLLAAMQSAPTWMATQAKVSIVYETPFWRRQGLSGRVASQLGPVVEMHDHCGMEGEPAALFGFVGLSFHQRQQVDCQSEIIAQLVRCFGNQAAEYLYFEMKDWSVDQYICSQADLRSPPEHPQALDNVLREGTCDGRVSFAVAETAINSPGLMDGAFEAGERATALALASFKR